MRLTAAHFALTAALALVPAASAAQHLRPSLTGATAPETAHAVDWAADRPLSLSATLTAVERRRASAGRHAGIGALAGLAAGTVVVAAMGYTYGTGYSSVPIVVKVVVTAGGAAIGAVGGLAIYGIKRLAQRD